MEQEISPSDAIRNVSETRVSSMARAIRLCLRRPRSRLDFVPLQRKRPLLPAQALIDSTCIAYLVSVLISPPHTGLARVTVVTFRPLRRAVRLVLLLGVDEQSRPL